MDQDWLDVRETNPGTDMMTFSVKKEGGAGRDQE